LSSEQNSSANTLLQVSCAFGQNTPGLGKHPHLPLTPQEYCWTSHLRAAPLRHGIEEFDLRHDIPESLGNEPEAEQMRFRSAARINKRRRAWIIV